MAIEIKARGRGNVPDVATTVPDPEPKPVVPPLAGRRGRGNVAEVMPPPPMPEPAQEPATAPQPRFTREDFNRNTQLIGEGRFDEVRVPDLNAGMSLSPEAISAEADILTLEFPSQAERIAELRASGKNSADIRRHMTEQEYRAVFIDGMRPDEVDSYLGRTPETRRAMYERAKSDQENAYYKILKGSMTRDQVRELLQVAEISGASPSLLHQYPELYRSVKELAGRRGSFMEYLAYAASQMNANRYLGNRQADLKDAQDLYLNPEERGGSGKGGPVGWGLMDWGDTALRPLSEEEAAALKEKALRNTSIIANDVRRVQEQIEGRGRLRPPDSAIGAFLLSIAESSGFSLQSGVVSGVGRAVGSGLGALAAGPAGAVAGYKMSGIAATLYNTNLEAKMEAGAILMERLQEILKSGVDFDAAVEQAFTDTREITREVYRENLLLLGATNVIGDFATFGMGSMFTRLASKVGGNTLSSKFLRGAIRQGLPLVAGALPEGVEEAGQEYIQQIARGMPVDDRTAWQAFKVGAGHSLVYAAVGRFLAGIGSGRRRTGTNAGTAVDFAKDIADKLAKGEISEESVVAEGDYIFVPVGAMDAALAKMQDGGASVRADYDLGVDYDENGNPIGDVGEYVIEKSQFESITKNHPELAAAVADDTREGVRGVTAREAILRSAKWVDEAMESPLNANTAEAAKARSYAEAFTEGLSTTGGVRPEIARAAGAFYGHSLLAQSANYGMDVETLHRARVVSANERVAGRRLNQDTGWRDAWQRLDEDEAAFGKTVDEFINARLPQGLEIRVMTTPLALNLAGADVLPIVATIKTLNKILIEKHGLPAEILKQVPRAMTRPVMIFESATRPKDSIVVMLDLQHEGSSVIVPVVLNKKGGQYEVNAIASAYPQRDQSGKPRNEWFVKQIKEGRLRYIDTEKSAEWANSVGLQLPKDSTLGALSIDDLPRRRLQSPLEGSRQSESRIATERDLVNRLNRNPGFYQSDGGNIKGAVTFDPESGNALIQLFENADAGTIFHELWHLGLDNLLTLGTVQGASATAKADRQRALEWLGIADLDLSNGYEGLIEADRERYTAAQEKWAAGGERYLESGKAPVLWLQGVFDRIRGWLLDTISGVAKTMDLPSDVADIYGRMLASPVRTDAAFDGSTTVSTLVDRSRETDGALRGEGPTFYQLEVDEKKANDEWLKRNRNNLGEQLKRDRAKMWEEIRRIRDNKAVLDRKKQDVKIMLKEILSAIRSKGIFAGTRDEIREMLLAYNLNRNHTVTRDMLTENQIAGRDARRFERASKEADRIIDLIDEDPMFAYEIYGDDITGRAEILNLLSRITLDQMTIAELAELYARVATKAEAGRQILRGIQAEAADRRKAARDALAARMISNKGRTAKHGMVAGREDAEKQYKGMFGAGERLKDWVYAATLGAQRLFDWFDGGKGRFDGPFVRLFVDRTNAARDAELTHVYERREKIEAKMRELGITLADLRKVRQVEGISRLNEGEADVTVDVLMDVYAKSKNESGRRALLYGVFQHYEDPEAAIAKCIDALTESEKNLTDAIIGDYMENRDRINEVVMREFNISMSREPLYTPLRHLEHSGSVLPSAPKANATTGTLGGDITSGFSRGVERGFTIDRVYISELGQSGLVLGLFSTWSDMVVTQEHTAAFAGLVNDLRAVMKHRPTKDEIEEGSAVKGESMKNLLVERFGNGAWRALEEYFKVIVQNDAAIADSVLNNLSSKIGRNMSIVYLCGNLGTLAKQTTSLGRTMFLAGPGETFSALGEFMSNPKQFLDEVYELDPQMRDRKGDPFIRAVRASNEWGDTALQRAMDRGLELVGTMDRWVAAVVWKSMYKKMIRQGADIRTAVREAQRTVALTQQTTHAKDAPQVWRQSGLARLAMIFTSEAAQVWGLRAYDFVQMVTSGDANQVKKGMAVIMGLSLSAMMMRMLTDGPPDRDDDETWLQWTALAFTEDAITSIPVVGKEMMAAVDELTGNRKFGPQYGALITPFYKIANGARQLMDDNADNNERAFWAMAEGLSLYLKPAPVTAARRIVDAVRMGSEGEIADALLRLAGQRRDMNRMKRSGMSGILF